MTMFYFTVLYALKRILRPCALSVLGLVHTRVVAGRER